MLGAAYPANPVEGGPASRNFAVSALAGPGALTAGPSGCALGRFAWADPVTGHCGNQPVTGAIPAIALPVCGPWTLAYWDSSLRARVLRPGYGVTLLWKGDVWLRFAGGATAGQIAYASTVDGSAISGYSASGVPTGFTVTRGCQPGELATVSTWSTFPA